MGEVSSFSIRLYLCFLVAKLLYRLHGLRRKGIRYPESMEVQVFIVVPNPEFDQEVKRTICWVQTRT